MTKQNQEKEFEFPPMRVLDRKTKELIKAKISDVVVHICIIYKFKNELPKSTLNKEIKELYNSVMTLQSMYFKDQRTYYKFVDKCFSYYKHISLSKEHELCLSDVIDLHALISMCANSFDSSSGVELLKAAATCINGNRVLKAIKFKVFSKKE